MPEWIRTIAKLTIVIIGLSFIYLGLDEVIKQTKSDLQRSRDNDASAYIIGSYISEQPFGESTNIVKRGTQIFYNINIKRHEGEPCQVHTSWRWSLRLPSGNTVTWNVDDGQFYGGDKSERFAHVVQVPESLIPGDYTLTRFAVFKCGDNEEFAKTVRNTDLRVE